MIEEALTLAVSAHGLRLSEGHLVESVREACEATGVRPPLLFVSEVNSALQTAIAYYNAERGHRREGFETLNLPNAKGGWHDVAESANDKAARLQYALKCDGKSLSTISAADAAILLHKCRHVTVKPNGARMRVGGVERLYWSENSVAIAAAQRNELGEKEYLALFNPEDPRELYLLHNPPGRVPRAADEMPAGEAPVFMEALPLYTAPDANDETALGERARRVAAVHGRVNVERMRTLVPFVAANAARRERNLQLSEPLAKAVNVLRNSAPKTEESDSDVSQAMFRQEEEIRMRQRYLRTLHETAPETPFDER